MNNRLIKREKAKVTRETRKLRLWQALVKLVRGNWQLRLPIEIRSFPFGTEEERGLEARRWSWPKGDSTPSFDSPHGIVPVTGLTARNCSLVWFSHGIQPLPTSAIPAIAIAPRMHKQSSLYQPAMLQTLPPSDLPERTTRFSNAFLSSIQPSIYILSIYFDRRPKLLWTYLSFISCLINNA